MAAMQALGPEMKKFQQKYKGAENRAQLNEEMMKLYKEHNVNPASGCLPMLLQMPAFFVLYSVIRGITNTRTIPAHTVGGLTVAPQVVAVPRYIPHDSDVRRHLSAHGQLNSFGIDFAEKLLSHHSSLFVAIPYLLLVVGSVGLQYLQMARLNARNPRASQANPQAAMLQKYMPLIFGFIYLNVAAILNVYFIVSSAIRISHPGDPVPTGDRAGPPTAPRRATATGRRSPRDRWRTGPNGPCPSRRPAGRRRPSGSGGRSRERGGGQRNRQGHGARQTARPRARRPGQGRGRRHRPVKPTASTNGTNGKSKGRAPRGRARPTAMGPARAEGSPGNGSNGGRRRRTDDGPATAPKSIPAPRRSVRERPDRGGVG